MSDTDSSGSPPGRGVALPRYTADRVEEELGVEFCREMETRAGGGKWTSHLWAKVLYATGLGMHKTEAAPYAGITRQCLNNWLKEFEPLAVQFEAAGPSGTAALVERLSEVADEHAMRWMLERRSASFAPPTKRTEIKQETEPVEIILRDKDVPADSIPVPTEISGHSDDPEEQEPQPEEP